MRSNVRRLFSLLLAVALVLGLGLTSVAAIESSLLTLQVTSQHVIRGDEVCVAVNTEADGVVADGKLTFDKANISVTADKNDMAKKIDVDFSLKAKLDEETVAMKFKTTVEFVSINTDLTIDFPDFEGYQEMTV